MSRYNKMIVPAVVNCIMLIIAVFMGEEVANNPEISGAVGILVNAFAIWAAPANKEKAV